jgi:hypothetical protein
VARPQWWLVQVLVYSPTFLPLASYKPTSVRHKPRIRPPPPPKRRECRFRRTLSAPGGLRSRQRYQSGTPRAVFQETNVTDWTQLSQMFKATCQVFGSVDIVCPDTAVYEPPFSSFRHPSGPNPPSKDSPEGGRCELLDINLNPSNLRHAARYFVFLGC